MSLTTLPITELTTESAPKAALAEWLADWFDGDAHSLLDSGVEVEFPAVNIAFDQSVITAQPMAGAEIRVIMDPAPVVLLSDEEGKLAENNVTINFWVRAKITSAGEGNSNYLANRVADLLVAILANPNARFPLAENGIMNCRPQHARVFADNNYALRLIRCQAQLQYKVRY